MDMFADLEVARSYLEAEYEEVQVCDGPLWEETHDRQYSINLGAWKRRGMPLEWLFQMLAAMVGKASLLENERMAKSACCLVDSRLVRILPILEALCRNRNETGDTEGNLNPGAEGEPGSGAGGIGQTGTLCAGSVQVVAIDGRCASGKSTMARQLSAITGAGVVHMDDFFLPRDLRTPERLQEPGGNIHYERFLQEIVPQLESGAAFSYRRFDCGRMELGESCLVPEGRIRVVEGAYSCHPVFGAYMDLQVFGDVEPTDQLTRIQKRNGADALEAFHTRWIPMEERYFKAFGILERASLRV